MWQIKDNVHQPYFGENSIHFNGFFSNYNMQAYLLVPGLFLIIYLENLNKIFKTFIILFIIFCLLLTKSKILILVLFFILILILFNFSNFYFLNQKKYLIFYFIFIFIFYFLITHFLILNNLDTVQNKNLIFLHYYTNQPIMSLFGFDIYGSLFYKLKLMAINLSSSYNYIFFNEINFKEIQMPYTEYTQGTDSHSEYFSSLANFGIFGFFLYLMFMLYPLNYSKFNLNSIDFSYTIVLLIFLIEAMVADTMHLQFLWFVILGIINLNSMKN